MSNSTKDASENPAKGVQTPTLPTKAVRSDDTKTVIITTRDKKK